MRATEGKGHRVSGSPKGKTEEESNNRTNVTRRRAHRKDSHNYDVVPLLLRGLRGFAMYRTAANGVLTYYEPNGVDHVDAPDAEDLATFQEACKAYASGKYDGIAFYARPEDKLCFLTCPDSLPFLGDLDDEETYCERTPSGERLYVFRGVPPERENKYIGLRVRTTGFVALTGNVIDAHPIRHLTSVLQQELEARALSTNDSFPIPRDLFSSVAAPPIEAANVPPVLANLAFAMSRTIGIDPNAVITAGIACGAAMLDNSVKVRPQPNYFESALFWGVIVGSGGIAKTAVLEAVKQPLIQKQAELEDIAHLIAEDGKPVLSERIFVEDATTEALQEIAQRSPRGLIYAVDEFNSWHGNLDAYRGGKGSKDKPFFLSSYTPGGPRYIDRKGHEPLLIPMLGIGLVATTTFTGLRQLLEGNRIPEDGLAQRFLFIAANTMGDPSAQARKEDISGHHKAWNQAVLRLWQWKPCVVTLEPKAEDAYRAESSHLHKLSEHYNDINLAYHMHVNKRAGMLARLALFFHAMLEAPGCTLMSETTMNMAIRFMRQQQAHSILVFETLTGRDRSTSLEVAVAKDILMHQLTEVSQTILHKHCGVYRVASEQARLNAVRSLVDASWLFGDRDFRYGTKWQVNPQVHQLYAKEGEKHRLHVEAVQGSIRIAGEQKHIAAMANVSTRA